MTTKLNLFNFFLEVLTNLPNGDEGNLQVEICVIPHVPDQKTGILFYFKY